MAATIFDDFQPRLSWPEDNFASEMYAGYVDETNLVSRGLFDAPEQESEQKAQSLTPRSTRIDPTTWAPHHVQRGQMLVANSSGSPWRHVISASQFDPFLTLPIQVDEVTNELLHFYSMKSYWRTAYALSSKVKPSMKGSWETQARICVSHFHILMARSALHQLYMNNNVPPKAQKRLEFAALQHQNEALTILRKQISFGPKADRKGILTSVISLATFEKRYGSHEKALVHFKVAKDIFRQIGKQDGINDLVREQQALWFEGIYADPEASFLWGKEDANARLCWLNELLVDVDRIWRNRQLLPLKTRKPFVAAHTRFHEFLSRDTEGKMISAYGDICEAAAQQRCMLVFLSIVTGLYRQGVRMAYSTTEPEIKTITGAVQSYSDWIEEMLVENDLDEKEAEADLLWIMLQDFRDVKPRSANAAALSALHRLDLRDRHWRACGIANVVKYLPRSTQVMLKSSLLAFIEGKRYDGKLSLNGFSFSYACM